MEKVIDNNKYEMYKLNILFKDSGHYTNSYILKDKKTSRCMLIDPAYNAEYIYKCLNEINGALKMIYLTHCHGDHTAALEDLYNKYIEDDVKIYIHKNDLDGIFDDDKNCKYILSEPDFCSLKKDDVFCVIEGMFLNVGEVILEVIHTPGHTDGSSILYEREYNILITGDTLFSDCYGRTDLKSGSQNDMKKSLNKIFNRFNSDALIFPGHGASSLLGDAKKKVELIVDFS